MRLAPPLAASAASFRLKPLAHSLSLSLVAGALLGGAGLVQAQARLPAGTLPVPAARWLQNGTGASFTQRINTLGTSTLRVNVTGPATVLNWTSMDVGSAAALSFTLPSATARVLNNVQGGLINSMTTIEGALRSNGQVYIYNPNGIVFGAGATVDVGSLVATSLRLDEQRFMNGLLSPSVDANLALDPLRKSMPGAVLVQAEQLPGGTLKQAAINAAQNGLILLAAPQVENAGALSAPDGQVVLAAGSKVYLATPTDAAMRGLRVEVGSDGLSALAGRPVAPAATNTGNGVVSVQRGNITMAGLSVNQQGMASATTSVNLNGSIFLRARDGAAKSGAATPAVATHGGTLTLGAGSITTVLPTLDDPATAQLPPAGQAFKPSQIELSGKTITLQASAQVVAPAGNITLEARVNPGSLDVLPNTSRIDLATGSVVDASGSTGAVLAMESNVVTAELRGTELADNLLLRNSALRGSSVRFDKRKAASGLPIANVQGYLNLLGYTVGEFTATGGNVSLRSEGAIQLAGGSTVNVSGGQVNYAGGYVNTTKLTLGNRLYDIETASAVLAYDGAINLANGSSNYEVGYSDGKSAGTVQLSAPAMQLGGALLAQVATGARQRVVGASGTPAGGQLLLGNIDSTTMDPTTGRTNFGALDQFGFAGAIDVGASRRAGALLLDVNALEASGFNRISAVTTGDISVGNDLALVGGGQLRLGAGGTLAVGGNISGSGASFTAAAFNRLQVADGVQFNLAGAWQNDSSAVAPARDANGLPLGSVNTRGGSVRLYGNQLQVGDRVGMDVSGGAWLSSTGSVSAGSAGSITLQATTQGTSLDASLLLGSGLQLAGYGLAGGGSVSLTGRNVAIGGAGMPGFAANLDTALPVEFFSQGGFASRSVTANANLWVAPGAALEPRTATWQLRDAAARTPGGAMATAAQTVLLPLAGPQGARPTSSLTLRATGRNLPGEAAGTLSVGAGARISADPAASVTLAADRQVLVNGTVDAPAGNITLSILTQSTDPQVGDGSAYGVLLGPQAVLSARGTADRVLVNGNGVASGEVLDGGTVRIGRPGTSGVDALVGHVVAEQGSVIDVSGVQRAGLQFRSGAQVLPAQDIASSGGAVEIKARDGLLLAGLLRGAGGSSQAHGGTLSLSLDRDDGSAGTQPLAFTLSAQPAGALQQPFTTVGQRLATPAGLGAISTDAFTGGGFGNLKFKSQDVLAFSGVTDLTASASIELNAPNLQALGSQGAGTQVTVRAPYVSLGNSDLRYQTTGAAAADGAGVLGVQARTLDLTGNSATQGFGRVSLAVQDDIRLVGAALPDSFGATGAFATGRQLTLASAQVYPVTLNSFDLSLTGPESVLLFAGNANSVNAAPVLSAGGAVSARADHIVQAGRLLAPFGSISLQATADLRYEAGSVTSVAGQGVVPFGAVVNGNAWTYDMGGQSVTWKVNPSADPSATEKVLPVKQIVSRAPVVQQAAGAVLDVSGGGKLYAYEFSPGPGGSADVLQGSGVRNTTFAINPNFRASVAPQDAQYGSDGLKVGDQVYLTEVSGLPAGLKEGYYTLLPGHYALQPGGYLLESASGTRDMTARDNRVNADQSLTVAGYKASSLDGLKDARSQGFVLTPYDLIRQRSEFKDYDANTFFAAQAASAGVTLPALPADAGKATFQVQTLLALEGSTRLGSDTAVASARRGQVDIAAPRIEVVASRTADTGSAVRLVADDLSAMAADSLLLGGLRSQAADGVHLTVTAEAVRINNTQAHPLRASELLVVASDSIAVGAQADMAASSPVTAPAQTLLVDGTGAGADGALMRLGGSAGGDVLRGAFAALHGRLDVAAGASVAASGAMVLDATRAMVVGTTLNLGEGAGLSIHAPQIALGSNAPQSAEVLTLGSDNLAAFSRLGALDLLSYAGMDAYGTVQLGSASMAKLRFGAATLQSHAANVTLAARSLALVGSGIPGAAAGTDASTGQFRASADQLLLQGSTIRLKGFGLAALQAQGELLAAGSDSGLVSDNAMQLTAARLGSAAGASGRFVAGATLQTSQVASPTAPGATAPGGRLVLEGDTVDSAANLVLPSGTVELRGARGVTVRAGMLDVHGLSQAFGTARADAPAGQITLDGGVGGVTVAPGAVLDLSAQGGSAGQLNVRAAGNAQARVELGGVLRGASGGRVDDSATRQGSFTLDVASMPDATALDALNARLNAAGFTESRDLRVRSGDVTLGQGSTVTARRIAIAADDGNLMLGGTLDARGPSGGSIQLYAAQFDGLGNRGQLVLSSTARLLAHATTNAATEAGSQGDGGQVLLSAANADGQAASRTDGGASVRADRGALINVSAAGSKGQGGTLTVRAPRVGSGAGSDVAVARFDASVQGSRQSQIEAVKVYQARSITEGADSATNLNAGLGGRMAGDSARFMAGQGSVAGRLARADLVLTPGVEVRSDADLLVSVNESALDRGSRGWDLHDWRFGGQAGTMTLRAQGNLNIQGSISDGFLKGGTADAVSNWLLDTSPQAWSLRLVGGNDAAAANPLAVKGSALQGDVRIGFARAATADDAAVAVVRTGAGHIDVSAGRDVVLASTAYTEPDTDPVPYGAALYTAGRASSLSAGFAAPVNLSNAQFGVAVNTAAAFGADGGGITVLAERDVKGPAVPQMVNNWLFRQGRSGVDASGRTVFEQVKESDNSVGALNTAWWSRTDYFSGGIATFAGGNIDVVARQGSVSDLSVNSATNAYMPGGVPGVSALREQGGGDVRVVAGDSILGGSFYAQKGSIALGAGKDVRGGNLSLFDVVATGRSDTDVFTAVRPVIALGDGQVNVVAGRNLEIETVYNPTLTRQGLGNVPTGLDINTAFLSFDNQTLPALNLKRTFRQYSAFSTYSAHSSVKLTSTGGQVLLNNNALLAAASAGSQQPLTDYGQNLAALLGLYPASLRVEALSGAIASAQGFAMAPAANGSMHLLAKQSVQLSSNGILYPGVVMLDNDPAGIPQTIAPGVLRRADLAVLTGSAIGLSAHTAGALHASDPEPVRIVALQGNIVGQADVVASLILPKRAEIVAGGDIRDLGFSIQNVGAADGTVVQAGRDIVDSTNLTTASPVKHVITGAGLASFVAGRDVDLGNGQGIVTRGNLDNPYLKEGGASVMVESGVGASRFDAGKNPFEVLRQNDELFQALFQGSKQALDETALQAALAGVAVNSPAGVALREVALAPFDQRVADAYQAGAVASGDIKVFGSQVKTEQGGSIDLLAPGGSVVAGLVSVPAYLQKSAADNGIFTVRGGAIRSLVRKDFTVNQGRVFSLGGGDITLISQMGNIDAGRGAKTASSAPPPLLTTDASGNTKLDIAGSIAGSGIATLRTAEAQAAGNVYAAAPRGIFDAGDAGVRSAGKVQVQAAVVLNASNIAASGGVGGSSAITSAGVSAAAAPAAAAPTVQDPAAQLPAAPKETLALTVEVLCFGLADGGENSCKDEEGGSGTPSSRPRPGAGSR